MRHRIVIGLAGLAGLIGAGKSTAAAHLVERHGFERLRFAGPLKAMGAALGLTFEQLDGAAKEQPCDLLCGKTPREFMQKLGTEFGRQMIGRELWVRAWRASCERLPERTPIVADDVRFPDEAAAVRALSPFSMIVRLTRDAVRPATLAHVSELQGFGADHRIANNGSIEELKAAVDNLLLWRESTTE